MKTLVTVLSIAILSSGCSLFKGKGRGANAGGGDGVPRNQNARIDNPNRRDTHDAGQRNNDVNDLNANNLNNPFDNNPFGLTDFNGLNNRNGDQEGLNKRGAEPTPLGKDAKSRESAPGDRQPAAEGGTASAPRSSATLASPFAP